MIVTGTGQVVAEHVLVAPGEASVLDDHYGGPRPAPRRAVRPKTAAEKAFCALGPVAEAFITGAAAAGHTRLGPELAELNTLRAAHGEQVFGAALSRAVAFGRWRAAVHDGRGGTAMALRGRPGFPPPVAVSKQVAGGRCGDAVAAEVQARAQRGELAGNRAEQGHGAARLQRRDDVTDPAGQPCERLRRGSGRREHVLPGGPGRREQPSRHGVKQVLTGAESRLSGCHIRGAWRAGFRGRRVQADADGGVGGGGGEV